MEVRTLVFSPTGTTRRIVDRVAKRIADLAGSTATEFDFTLPSTRRLPPSFEEGDFVVAGIPVYAGRVPNVLLRFFETLSGNGASVAALVVYGNRDYDDALVEFKDILEARGFRVTSCAAFVGEHAFSNAIAAGRPDRDDLAAADAFATSTFDKHTHAFGPATFAVKGSIPYRRYYQPRDRHGNPIAFTKIVPKTGPGCTRCGRCASVCPMGSIDPDDPSRLVGICIKCCACIKACPVGAKEFDDEGFLLHKFELESAFSGIRKAPEWFM